MAAQSWDFLTLTHILKQSFRQTFPFKGLFIQSWPGPLKCIWCISYYPNPRHSFLVYIFFPNRILKKKIELYYIYLYLSTHIHIYRKSLLSRCRICCPLFPLAPWEGTRCPGLCCAECASTSSFPSWEQTGPRQIREALTGPFYTPQK